VKAANEIIFTKKKEKKSTSKKKAPAPAIWKAQFSVFFCDT